MRKTGKQQITDAKATAKKQAELKEEFIKARKVVYSKVYRARKKGKNISTINIPMPEKITSKDIQEVRKINIYDYEIKQDSEEQLIAEWNKAVSAARSRAYRLNKKGAHIHLELNRPDNLTRADIEQIKNMDVRIFDDKIEPIKSPKTVTTELGKIDPETGEILELSRAGEKALGKPKYITSELGKIDSETGEIIELSEPAKEALKPQEELKDVWYYENTETGEIYSDQNSNIYKRDKKGHFVRDIHTGTLQLKDNIIPVYKQMNEKEYEDLVWNLLTDRFKNVNEMGRDRILKFFEEQRAKGRTAADIQDMLDKASADGHNVQKEVLYETDEAAVANTLAAFEKYLDKNENQSHIMEFSEDDELYEDWEEIY